MTNMKTRVDIDTKTFVRFWLVVIGFGFAIAAIYLASTALLIIGISLFLALALNAPVSRLARLLPGKSRVGATALAYIVVVAILGAVVTLVIPPIVQQSAQFAQTIPSMISQATGDGSPLRGFIDEYNLQPQVDSAVASIQSSAAGWASNVGQSLVSGIGSFFAFVTALILVLVLTFLMLVEGPAALKRMWGFYSDRKRMETHRRILNRMYNVVNGYVTGQLMVSAVGATFSGLMVFVLSLIFPEIPSSLAFPIAAFSFVLGLIPMFGSAIAGILGSILIAFSSIPAAIAYIIFFAIYQQVENNVVAPGIQSKRIELSALTVLVAVTIGIYLFGILGGIIAIPIAGSIRVLLEEYLEWARNEREEDTKLLAAKNKTKKKAS